ncbi:hypothetical protein C8Q72DRAFT_949830 [Fomitopsis betulina]|nr:hypothetical protein C8Q72DRAFT_949830 [Fomitopsis betulina]
MIMECQVVTQLSTIAAEIDLDALNPDTSVPLPIHFSFSSTCYIYSCKLKRAYAGIDHVVCKLSLHEKGRKLLKHEASVYEQLKLGDRMPHFFGLYESESVVTGFCCLILEYCGISLGQKGNLLGDQKEKFPKGLLDLPTHGSQFIYPTRFTAANACTATARDDLKKPLVEEEIMKRTSPHVWLEIASTSPMRIEIVWNRVKLLVQQAIADYEQKMSEQLKTVKRQEDDP